MSTERVILEVEQREVAGTTGARAVRRDGKIPGVLYGNGREAVAIAVETRAIREAVIAAGGRHAIFDVKLAGTAKAVPAIIKEIQLHPVRDTAIHFDLYEVNLTRAIQSPVTIVLVGESVGVKNFAGQLSQPTHEVICEALPDALPEHLEVDVSELGLGDSIRLSDLQPPEGVIVIGDDDLVIVSVAAPRGASEDELADEAAAAEASAEAAGAAEGEPDEGADTEE